VTKTYSEATLSNESLVPVLIIGFNRPKNLAETLDSLDIGRCSKIYISIDGPRNAYDIEQQAEIASVISRFVKNNSISVAVNQSEVNLGCALGVVHAIDWFFSHETAGLVLEDDLVISDDFFRILSAFLAEADLATEVFSAYAPFETSGAKSPFWESKYLFISGWYLSKILWEETTADMFRFHIPYTRNKKGHKRSLGESIFWWAACMRVSLGFTDTWDCVFYDSFWRNGKKSYVPRISLISNTGFDQFGTHTKVAEDDLQFLHGTTYGHFVDTQNLDEYVKNYYFRIQTRHLITPVLSLILKILVESVKKDPKIRNQRKRINKFVKLK
jgi:hypothetical protein